MTLHEALEQIRAQHLLIGLISFPLTQAETTGRKFSTTYAAATAVNNARCLVPTSPRAPGSQVGGGGASHGYPFLSGLLPFDNTAISTRFIAESGQGAPRQIHSCALHGPIAGSKVSQVSGHSSVENNAVSTETERFITTDLRIKTCPWN